MKTVFYADDGKKFYFEEECVAYEKEVKEKRIEAERKAAEEKAKKEAENKAIEQSRASVELCVTNLNNAINEYEKRNNDKVSIMTVNGEIKTSYYKQPNKLVSMASIFDEWLRTM